MKFWTNKLGQPVYWVCGGQKELWVGWKKTESESYRGLEGEEEWMKEDRVRGREGEIEEGRER